MERMSRRLEKAMQQGTGRSKRPRAGRTVDGRQGTRGHGYPMPVCGKRLARDLDTDDYGSEEIIRGRILSIAYYLESLQE